MTIRESNKEVALITGSSRGIGASIVECFAKNGYNVVINYTKSSEKANALKQRCENQYNIKAFCIKADVSNEQQVSKMIESIISEFGKLDVVVNNAGIVYDTDFEDRTVTQWQETLNVNLIGPFLVSKYAAKHMLKNKQGKIINISSTNGINTCYPTSIDYDASKAGIISLTHNLAIQFAPYINVNAIAPGWVNTEMNKSLDEDFIAAETEKICLKRFADPSEIAELAFFLASPAANYINGEVIKIDGGMFL